MAAQRPGQWVRENEQILCWLLGVVAAVFLMAVPLRGGWGYGIGSVVGVAGMVLVLAVSSREESRERDAQDRERATRLERLAATSAADGAERTWLRERGWVSGSARAAVPDWSREKS